MKLSIIIPVYNAEKYIVRCIESVYAQGIEQSDFEVIAVNDGSKDNSLQLLQQLAERKYNMTVLSQDNAGAAAARNLGMENAKGEYLMFVDSDDFLLDGKASNLLGICEEESLDILYYRLLIRDADAKHADVKGVGNQHMPVGKVMTGTECYRRGFLASTMCGCLCRRQLLEEKGLRFSNIRFGEDAELSYSITAYAKRVMFLDEAPYVYLKNSVSVLQNMDVEQQLQQIADTVRVGTTLRNLSQSMDDRELASLLSIHASKIIFGSLFSMWRNRRIFKKQGKFKTFVSELTNDGLLPFRGPYHSCLKWLVVQFTINNKLFYS